MKALKQVFAAFFKFSSNGFAIKISSKLSATWKMYDLNEICKAFKSHKDYEIENFIKNHTLLTISMFKEHNSNFLSQFPHQTLLNFDIQLRRKAHISAEQFKQFPCSFFIIIFRCFHVEKFICWALITLLKSLAEIYYGSLTLIIYMHQ